MICSFWKGLVWFGSWPYGRDSFRGKSLSSTYLR